MRAKIGASKLEIGIKFKHLRGGGTPPLRLPRLHQSIYGLNIFLGHNAGPGPLAVNVMSPPSFKTN